MVGGDRVLVPDQRLTSRIPGHRAGAMSGIAGVGAVEPDGAVTRVHAELGGGDLVGGDAVVEALPRLRVAVGPREPEGAPPVGFIAELVREALDEREVFLVFGERGESGRQRVVGSGVLEGREPSLIGHPVAEAQEDHPLRLRGRFLGGEGLEAQRAQRGQGDQRAGGAEEVTAAEVGSAHLVWKVSERTSARRKAAI